VAKNIDFKALRASVVVSSECDPRWNFHAEKSGNQPADEFSLRSDLVHGCSERLYLLQESLGSPPSDLVFKVTEEWSAVAV
jgi:hypothetical protein